MKILSIINSMHLSLGGPPEVLRNQIKVINADSKIIDVFSISLCGIFFFIKCFIFKSYRKRIYKFLKKYDVIHFHELWSIKPIFICYFANKLSIKFFYVGHGYLDTWSINQKYIKKKLFINFILQYAFNSASATFFSTENEYHEAKKNIKIHSPFIIPNGIDFSNFKKRDLKINQSKKKILFFGRIHKKKGIEILLEAVTKLPIEYFNNFIFEITGPGLDKNIKLVKKIIFANNLEKKVNLNLPIKREKKIEYLRKNDVFILPSFEEGDSIALKEALASYMPVIISEQCRMNIIKDYEAGFIIKSNVESLYNALIKLQFVDLNKMGYQARKVVEDNYNNNDCSLRLLEIYKNIHCGSRKSNDWLDINE